MRLLADLLFEKGESVADVCRLLEPFAEPKKVRQWYTRHQQLNGWPADGAVRGRRIPRPPISWDSILIDDLRRMLDTGYDLTEQAVAGTAGQTANASCNHGATDANRLPGANERPIGNKKDCA